jgi:hypothetical protein
MRWTFLVLLMGVETCVPSDDVGPACEAVEESADCIEGRSFEACCDTDADGNAANCAYSFEDGHEIAFNENNVDERADEAGDYCLGLE